MSANGLTFFPVVLFKYLKLHNRGKNGYLFDPIVRLQFDDCYVIWDRAYYELVSREQQQGKLTVSCYSKEALPYESLLWYAFLNIWKSGTFRNALRSFLSNDWYGKRKWFGQNTNVSEPKIPQKWSTFMVASHLTICCCEKQMEEKFAQRDQKAGGKLLYLVGLSKNEAQVGEPGTAFKGIRGLTYYIHNHVWRK